MAEYAASSCQSKGCPGRTSPIPTRGARSPSPPFGPTETRGEGRGEKEAPPSMEMERRVWDLLTCESHYVLIFCLTDMWVPLFKKNIQFLYFASNAITPSRRTMTNSNQPRKHHIRRNRRPNCLWDLTGINFIRINFIKKLCVKSWA